MMYYQIIIFLLAFSYGNSSKCMRLFRRDQFSKSKPSETVQLDYGKVFKYDPQSCVGYKPNPLDTTIVPLVIASILGKQNIAGLTKVSYSSPLDRMIYVNTRNYLYKSRDLFDDWNIRFGRSDIECKMHSGVEYQSSFPITYSSLQTIKKRGGTEMSGRIVYIHGPSAKPFLNANLTVDTPGSFYVGLEGLSDDQFSLLLSELKLMFNDRQVNPKNVDEFNGKFWYEGNIPLAHPFKIEDRLQYYDCRYKNNGCNRGCGQSYYIPYLLRGPGNTRFKIHPYEVSKLTGSGDNCNPFIYRLTGLSFKGSSPLDDYDYSRIIDPDNNYYLPVHYATRQSGKNHYPKCTSNDRDKCNAGLTQCSSFVPDMCVSNSTGHITYRGKVNDDQGPGWYQNDAFKYDRQGRADMGLLLTYISMINVQPAHLNTYHIKYPQSVKFKYQQCDYYNFTVIGITRHGMYFSNFSVDNFRKCMLGHPPLIKHSGRLRRSVSLGNGSHVGNTSLSCDQKSNYVCTVHLTCPQGIDTAKVSETVEQASSDCQYNLRGYFAPYVWVAIVGSLLGVLVGLPAVIIVIKNRKIIKFCC